MTRELTEADLRVERDGLLEGGRTLEQVERMQRAADGRIELALNVARRTMQNEHYDRPRIGMENECALVDELLARIGPRTDGAMGLARCTECKREYRLFPTQARRCEHCGATPIELVGLVRFFSPPETPAGVHAPQPQAPQSGMRSDCYLCTAINGVCPDHAERGHDTSRGTPSAPVSPHDSTHGP